MPEPDLPDLPDISPDDLDAIRARMMARANLGLEPGDPLFQDAVPGSIWGDVEGPMALEGDELNDTANEVLRAALPSTAYGEWLDAWADCLGLERKGEAFAGGVAKITGIDGTVVNAGAQFTTIATGDATDPVAFQATASGTIGDDTTGILELPVVAVLAGSGGNVAIGTSAECGAVPAGATAVTNEQPMTGGADVETDEALSGRVLDALAGDLGAGTQADYRRWCLSYPGVGFVTVQPVWDGPGTVRCFIRDTDNNPSPPATVTGLQALLDPVPNAGLGLAPIGHEVTVDTPDLFAVVVEATPSFEPGYSLDGAGGTRALRALIEAAIRRYVDGLDVGEDVVRYKVIAAIVSVPGVANASAIEINNLTTSTVAVAADQVANASAPVLT